MDFYLDEKQRKKRHRLLKLKIYGVLFLFFALIIGAAYAVVYSPLFKIKNIAQIDTDKLVEKLKDFFANQSKITEFLGPENILIWDTKKIGQFPKNPEIAEIKIEKDYIERQIKITVQKREKFGIWCVIEQTGTSTQESATDNCFWFDKNGIIFSSAPMVEGSLINKVDDFSGRSFKLGESVLSEKFFFNLIKIFELLEKSGLKIKSLKLENLQFQEIISEPINSLPKIYFSLRIDPNFGLSAIESLRKTGLEKVEYIDLRVENRAYYKLK